MAYLLRLGLASVLLVILAASSEAAVRDFSKKFALALVSQTDSYSLILTPTIAGRAARVDYRPNTAPTSGFEVTAFGLSLAYRTAQVIQPTQKQSRGETSYEDIRGALSLGSDKQWTLVGYYNRYGGLYIENSGDFDPTFSTTQIHIQRSDLAIFNSGIATIYVFNPERFSLAAAIFQSAQQTESAGSWLAMAGWDGTLFSATDPLIPSQVQSQFDEDALLTSGKFTTASLAFGYGHTFTARSFFLTLVGLIGPGYQWREYTVASETKSSTINTSKSILGATLGYNGETFYSGLSGIYNWTNYHTESVNFAVNLASIRAFIGVRF